MFSSTPNSKPMFQQGTPNLSKQKGVMDITAIFAIMFGILIILLGVKIAPLYIDHWSVKEAIKGTMAEAAESKKPSKGKILKLLGRRLDVNRIDFIKSEHLTFKREKDRITATLDYERRAPFLFNIDLVLKFPEVNFEAPLLK